MGESRLGLRAKNRVIFNPCVRSYKIHLLAASYCLLSGLTVSVPLAASFPTSEFVIQQDLVSYDIPSQGLDNALRAYATQTDLQIIFSPLLVEKLNSSAISDLLAPVEGLRRLLYGTGLDFVFINFRTVVIKSGNKSIADRVNDDTSLKSIESDTSFSSPQSSSPAEPIVQTETLKGHVISAYTGKTLAGVTIDVPDMGVRVATDARGFYTINHVPIGNVRLSIRYFGKPAEEHFIFLDPETSSDFELRFGYTEIEEITVTGARAASSYSINRQRISSNITSVLASDLTGELPDRTLAEALRRAPGVSFQRSERGGDGEFVSIRGLDAGLNYVTVNGIAAPASGIGDDRRIALDSFETDGISQIIINKTLLPHQPTEGIGGVIDIDTSIATKGSAKRTSLALETVYSDFSDKLGYRASGAFADTFGADDDFKIAANFYSSRRFLRTIQFDVISTFLPDRLPIGSDGTPASTPDGLVFAVEDLPILEDLRVNVFDDRRDRYGGALSLSWQVNARTQLSFDSFYNRRNVDTVGSAISFEQRDAFTNLLADSNELIAPDTGQFFFVGENPFIRYRAEVEDQDREVFITSFKSETLYDRGTIIFGAGYSDGRENFPLSTEVDFNFINLSEDLLPAVEPTGARFITFDISNPRFPIPSLTENGFTEIASPENFDFRDVRLESATEFDQRYTAYIDADFELNSPIVQKIQIGARYEHIDIRESRTRFFDDDTTDASGQLGGDGQFDLVDTELAGDALISFSRLGDPVPGFQGIFQANRPNIIEFSDNLFPSLDTSLFGEGVNDTFQEGNEEKISFYVSGSYENNAGLSFVGGVRFEQYFGAFRSSRVLEIDDRLNGLEDIALRVDSNTSERTENFEILPRFVLNYAVSDSLVLKAGFFESIVRPSFSTLAAPEDVEVNEASSELSLFLNQPNARNAQASNIDLSLQYYGLKDTFFEANLFFKKIDNFALQRSFNITRPVTTDEIESILAEFGMILSDNFVLQAAEVETRISGLTAEIYGFDLSFVHQFKNLPGWLDGFGVRGGFLWQNSQLSLPGNVNTTQTLTLFNSPSVVTTFGLLYEKYGFNASTFISYQGRQLDSFNQGFPNEFEEPFASLDLRLEYRFPLGNAQSASVYFVATDITDGGRKPVNHETAGAGERLLDDVEFNGRELRLGLRYNF